MTVVSGVREIPFQGVRLRFESELGFDDVVEALLDDVGHEPVAIDDFAKRFDTWASYEHEVQSHVGPAGFMLFATLNHGAWIKKTGIDQRVLRVVIGNPLIAITMMRHDMTAGLFAPVELLITEEAGGSAVTYVVPSSLVVVEPDPPLLAAALALDAKLEALVAKVTRAA
jgi:uncharacterized protein (DUF302 family)